MSYIRQIARGASEDRLEKLIAERLQPGADKEAIDARIWSLFGERWAVMFTDLAGFSRRVAEFGIIHFLQIIHESQRILVTDAVRSAVCDTLPGDLSFEAIDFVPPGAEAAHRLRYSLLNTGP